MKWPFVHRARLEAAEYTVRVAEAYTKTLVDNHNMAAAANKDLIEQIIAMKQQGFAPVPSRTATAPGVPYRGAEIVSREKLIKQFSEEPGITPEKAAEAADQFMAELG